MASRILLEICVGSVEDAITACTGGADRIELNAGLELGGLTPSMGTLIEVRRAVSIPVIAMVRPRPGHFCYSMAEFAVMQRDIELVLQHGADAVAVGMLQGDGQVDLERMRAVVSQAGKVPVVFHRAFDLTHDPGRALDQLIDMGVARILTSGQRATALEGAPLIAELIARAAGRIQVLPAGGIRAENVRELIAKAGCDEVHSSVRQRHPETKSHNFDLSIQIGLDAGYDTASPKLLAELVRAIGGPPNTGRSGAV